MRDLVHWAAALMAEGAALPARIPGRAGWELRLVVHGGWRVLEKIAQMGYASMAQRPRLHISDSASDFPGSAEDAIESITAKQDPDRNNVRHNMAGSLGEERIPTRT